MVQALKIFTIVYFTLTCSQVFALSCQTNKKEIIFSKRPNLEEGFHVHSEVEIEINKTPDQVEVWFDNVSPSKIIKGTKAVSGIKSTQLLSKKTWGEIGSTRLICNNDGTSILEELLENKRNDIFKYVLWDFTSDVTHAIKYAIAHFEVEQISDSKSVLKWHFAFRPNNLAYRLPLTLYVKHSFTEYMEQEILNIKDFIESN